MQPTSMPIVWFFRLKKIARFATQLLENGSNLLNAPWSRRDEAGAESILRPVARARMNREARLLVEHLNEAHHLPSAAS